VAGSECTSIRILEDDRYDEKIMAIKRSTEGGHFWRLGAVFMVLRVTRIVGGEMKREDSGAGGSF